MINLHPLLKFNTPVIHKEEIDILDDTSEYNHFTQILNYSVECAAKKKKTMCKQTSSNGKRDTKADDGLSS